VYTALSTELSSEARGRLMKERERFGVRLPAKGHGHHRLMKSRGRFPHFIEGPTREGRLDIMTTSTTQTL